MSYSEDKFKDHIRQVVRSQERDSERPLTLDELKELALSMGLTESEWNQLLFRAEKALNQAVAHMKVQNYTDAIQSAEEATSINPYIKDGNAILAQCYLKLALVDANEELFVKAENYARMELRSDPLDGTALNVLSAIEANKQEGRSSKKTLRLVALVGGAVLLAFLILWMCSHRATPPQNDLPEHPKQEQSDPYGNLRLLEQEAAAQQEAYRTAIERRNQLALELLGAVDDQKLRTALQRDITEYDWNNMASSEQVFLLDWGSAKAEGYFSEGDLVRMEGSFNRIATEKKRYREKAARFNTELKQHPEASDQFSPFETHE